MLGTYYFSAWSTDDLAGVLALVKNLGKGEGIEIPVFSHA
jgi:pantothenate kinase